MYSWTKNGRPCVICFGSCKRDPPFLFSNYDLHQLCSEKGQNPLINLVRFTVVGKLNSNRKSSICQTLFNAARLMTLTPSLSALRIASSICLLIPSVANGKKYCKKKWGKRRKINIHGGKRNVTTAFWLIWTHLKATSRYNPRLV